MEMRFLHCGNQASALIRGKSYPIVGRVTMDQTLIDLTEGPENLANGEVVTLIGNKVIVLFHWKP